MAFINSSPVSDGLLKVESILLASNQTLSVKRKLLNTASEIDADKIYFKYFPSCFLGGVAFEW